MAETEGIIKFELAFEQAALLDGNIDISTGADISAGIAVLNLWRDTLMAKALIGADPDRYGGLGFGNLSCRLPSGFLITASQTGDINRLTAAHYSHVTDVSLSENRITARGLSKPSSESLSHSAVYAANSAIMYVFHVHSPEIWRAYEKLGLSATAANIRYGSQAMAFEMKRLTRASQGLFVMAGHEDGVIAYGQEARQAGQLLIDALLNSLEVTAN